MATFVLTVAFAALCLGALFLAWVAAASRAGSPRGLMIAAAVFAGLATWGIADLARAQDGGHGQGHAESHDWYQELKQPGTGYSCCNGTVNGIEGDCRPTRAYLTDEGQWRALLDGRWINVPPRAVLKQLAPDGNSHICASKSGMIFCFLGGSPKS